MASLDISVRWSEEDSVWIATTTRFPSLSWIADTRDDATRGLRILLDDLAADLDRD